MLNFSKNKKLNKVLNTILNEELELGIDTIKKYYNDYKNEYDYNIYNYGNLRVYYDDIKELYQEYKSLKNASDLKLEEIYKKQIRYITRFIVRNYN